MFLCQCSLLEANHSHDLPHNEKVILEPPLSCMTESTGTTESLASSNGIRYTSVLGMSLTLLSPYYIASLVSFVAN